MNAGDMDKLHEELIAYLEGELAPEDRARVEREIQESREVHAELDWLRRVYVDIEAIEGIAQPATAEIDIVADVMDAVQRASGPAEVVSLNDVRKKRGLILPSLAAAAAAVVVGYTLFRALDVTPATPLEPGNPDNIQITTPSPATPHREVPMELDEIKHKLDEQQGLKLDTLLGPEAMESTQGPRLELPGGVSEVVAARADATMNRDRMKRLLDWARLPQKEALALADAPGASPEVMLGAAENLSGDDQRRVLLTAVGKLENDPNSRIQLARAYTEEPPEESVATAENNAKAIVQLSDVKAIDPDNALPYYYEAKLQLDQGNSAAALAALEAAGKMNAASAYSLESALAQAEALEAAGMEADAAQMLAALTAGVDENKFLCQLAADLLGYGQGFLSENDSATAEAIFKGVGELGRQVEAGASLSQEQLAGLDIQRQALGELGQLYTTVESADGVASVTEATDALRIQVEDLAGFFTALDELFLTPMTTEFWNMLSGIILGSGDLSIFSNPDVTSATPAAATQ